MAEDITSILVKISDADLADLRERLQRTRWPEPETVTDWSQGVPLTYLQDLCARPPVDCPQIHLSIMRRDRGVRS